MKKPSGTRHEHYELLNLIGYGLAKFEGDLIRSLGFASKAELYRHLIERGVANTIGTLKNRQDLFNPLVRQTRTGWWQNGDRYLHRKLLLDSLFGTLDASKYARLLQDYLKDQYPIVGDPPVPLSPLLQSKFRGMQETGLEAELYFMNRFSTLPEFESGILEDARLFGDGYDFQITLPASHALVDVKGMRSLNGSVRLTEKEYQRAEEYSNRYCLVVVSGLQSVPQMSLYFDPLRQMTFTSQLIAVEQLQYTSPNRQW